MYAIGQGVPRDYAQAAAWYRKAAEQGKALAQSTWLVLRRRTGRAAGPRAGRGMVP